MEIGEKIKKIRTAKLMTQRELAGTEITRNMLSRIENGAALPSMQTIQYIASRLNVSCGFLLADEEDELLYFKSSEVANIKKAYSAKNFRLCREMCKNSEWSDDELRLILADSCFNVGVEEFCNGYLHSATELFDEAIENCEQTIYNTDIIRSAINSYFEYMQMISPSLSSNVSDEDEISVMITGGFCAYSHAFCNECSAESLSEESSYYIHLRAREFMEKNEYKEAFELLHKLLFDDSYEVPEPMLYFVFCDLEICCKEIGDFKGAYEYSGNKIDLLQKLLS